MLQDWGRSIGIVYHALQATITSANDNTWDFLPTFELIYVWKDWAFINSLYFKFDSAVREFFRIDDDSATEVQNDRVVERRFFEFRNDHSLA
jgi:hypothetical protein